jgi:hypothetical protein
MHISRYPKSATTAGRIVTASSGNFISGHYNFSYEGGAHHNNYWITPSGSATQNKWLLSTDMTKLYRANGRDLTYKADNGQVTAATPPTGLGINNYSAEPTDWQVLDFLVFNRQLTNGEIRAVENYLARVYGLTLDVASTTSDTDTAATMGSSSANYYYFNSLSAGSIMNDTFTVEAWVKPASTCEAAICQIVVKENTILFGIQNGILHWALYGTGKGWVWTTTGIRVKPDEWSHVSMVKELAGDLNGSLKFYLNGKLVFTQSGSPYVAGTNTNSASSSYKVYDPDNQWYLFGGRADQYFYGEIDEIKVWSVARSEAEVRSDMISNDGSSLNMQMYYNFNMDALTYPDIDNTWITPIVPNLAAGGVARTYLYTYYASTYPTVESRSTDGPYSKISFPRTIITKNGGWKVPSGVGQIQTVLVGGGGGGGGGYQGGGGGGGGFIETVTTLSPGTVYPIVVGVGGRGALIPLTPTNGDSTTAFNLAAVGGGAGASEYNVSSVNVQYAPGTGGSGGGGSWSLNFPGGSGTSGQGNSGGSSTVFDEAACGAGNTAFVGGGGGGAGSVGENASCNKGGNGGSGRSSTVLGTVVAGGGGGSLRPYTRSITSAVRGLAGSGGGGIAGWGDGSATGSANGPGNGSANTGGGGGAGYSSVGVLGVGGAGGSGVVALRYITAAKPTYTKPTNAYLNV